MAEIAPPPPDGYDIGVETLIIGAGACGLVAGLAAREAGQEVLIVEADPSPSGSTALSAGLIPAAGTKLQRAAGVEDRPELFAQDIQRKAKGENDVALVQAMAEGAGPVIDWLSDQHGMAFSLVDDFDYPGHSRRRMHGLPSRAGSELIVALLSAARGAGSDVVTHRRATVLHNRDRMITGVTVETPDGHIERIACRKLILACNGFGGNRQMVAGHMPEIADALWFGHDGNRGEAVNWGAALGARTRHLGAYQGHGNVAHPHGVLITWAVITEGGVQVNVHGQRFWDESQGYSEAARAVLAQPGGIAFTIFDERIAGIARQFEDFKTAETQGAILQANSHQALADAIDVPAEALVATLSDVPADKRDAFGRRFSTPPLRPPFYGVRVTGALFHTQGGLVTTPEGQVLHKNGRVFDNLYAGGGAACGVSGSGDSGYLSGNGLLSAVVLGRAAGRASV